MPDELENFQTSGESWQERAEKYEGVKAIYSPKSFRISQWLALLSSGCLYKTVQRLEPACTVLDFGCGIGHHTKLLALHSEYAIGFDITAGMLQRARSEYKELPILFGQIDGVHLPLETNSIDFIWICGVLRYSLNVPQPKHKEIVTEFHRVLKPGGYICNYEMYVNQPSSDFSRDFLDMGFSLRSVSVVNLYRSKFEKAAIGKFHSFFLRQWWANISEWATRITVKEKQLNKEMRDYFFIYQR